MRSFSGFLTYTQVYRSHTQEHIAHIHIPILDTHSKTQRQIHSHTVTYTNPQTLTHTYTDTHTTGQWTLSILCSRGPGNLTIHTETQIFQKSYKQNMTVF